MVEVACHSLFMDKNTPKCCFSNVKIALTEEAAIPMFRDVQMETQVRTQLRCHPYQVHMLLI